MWRINSSSAVHILIIGLPYTACIWQEIIQIALKKQKTGSQPLLKKASQVYDWLIVIDRQQDYLPLSFDSLTQTLKLE